MSSLVNPVPQDFSTTLYNQIQPGLFMGGTADDDVCFGTAGAKRPEDILPFDAIVTMYSWAKPAYWEIQEMRYGIYDSNMEDVDFDRLGEVVKFAHRHWKNGDRVLVRCQAGLNRSGLVTALTLMYEGATAKEAIMCIRRNRSADALFNQNYVRWLTAEGSAFISYLKSQPGYYTATMTEEADSI